jgi:tetratricopeptide (TPR) repeat protein
VTVAVLFGGLVLYLTQQRAIINRNYETAVASAQSLLDQVRESLNRGDITTNGALGMLATASNIVQRVPKSETLASAALFANLEWTACDIYFSLGDLNEAYSRAKRARDFVEPFYEARPSDPETLRAVYFSTWRMADAISHRGLDREYQLRALPLYAEAERLARLLMDKSPEDRAWQRELVFVLGKLGDVRLGLREWTRAIETYREAVPIMRAVADSQPDNRGWQRDLADAVARVGDGLSANRQFDEALAPLEEALEIRKNLAARYRDDATIQGSVAIGRGRIARLYERWGRPGDLDLALEQYRIAIEVLEILLGRDSANAFWQNLVAPWYSQSGALLIKKGELTAALAQYQKAYPLRRALALRDPIPARQYESADAAIKVANLLVELKSLSEAVRIYREAVETLDEVRPKYDLDVFQIHIKIGDVLAMQGELPNALTEYETASDIARKAAAADPTSGPWQKVLEESYLKIGEFLIRQGRPRDALDHYQKALKFVDELAAKHADVGAWATLAQRLKAEIAKLT